MKLAVISDIHGNHFGLRAVLKRIKSFKINKVLILGDFVGYYYWPEKVINMLSKFDCSAVAGNHEFLLKKSMEDKNFLHQVNVKYGNGIEQAIKKLSKKEIEWLTNLPENKIIHIEKETFFLCHGSPWNNNEYVYPNKFCKFKHRYSDYPYRWILQGHTHYPMIKKNEDSIIINPGSVGQPRDGSGKAQWAMIDIKNRITKFFNEVYNSEELLETVEKINPELPYLKNILIGKK